MTPGTSRSRIPGKAQEKALQSLAPFYARIKYGQEHQATPNISIDDFRTTFPTASYNQLQPWLEKVRNGEYASLLGEPSRDG